MRSKEVGRFFLVPFLNIALISYISSNAFTSGVRRQIRKEANGCCQACGAIVGNDNLIAGHLVHGNGDKYNRLENGRAHCLFCETKYHLAHALNPQKIGLKHDDNVAAVKSLLSRLVRQNEEQADELISQYPIQWQHIQKRRSKQKK